MQPPLQQQDLGNVLQTIYNQYHHRTYVHPDPLEFLYEWETKREREIVGLVASSLAYGRVVQILKSVSEALSHLFPSPYRFVTRTPLKAMKQIFSTFRHRFADGNQMATLLYGAGRVIRQYGSLENCIAEGLSVDSNCPKSGLVHLFHRLTCGRGHPGHLLPNPAKSSACKRLHLYLRWMVRSDAIDPGGWQTIPPSALMIPLDTHMHTIGIRLGFTERRQADIRTALEITNGFRAICPEDPTRYDFSLSRLGIRSELNISILPEFTASHKP